MDTHRGRAATALTLVLTLCLDAVSNNKMFVTLKAAQYFFHLDVMLSSCLRYLHMYGYTEQKTQEPERCPPMQTISIEIR